MVHRLQGQKVKSQSHGAGAYCGGHLAAQLVYLAVTTAGEVLLYVNSITMMLWVAMVLLADL